MGVLAPARPRANITVRRTARPRQQQILPTPGTHHAHARRTARTRQAHSTHTPSTRKQLHTYTRTTPDDHEHASAQSAPGLPTTTSTQAHIHAHNSRQARIAWATTAHCPHLVHDAQAGRRTTAAKQTPTWHDVATSTRPRPRPQHTAKSPPATTPTHAHNARCRARTPTHTDAFQRVCRGTANYSRPPSPARLLRSGCGRRSPARPCRASFLPSPSARALRAARTHAEPRRSITTIAQSPPVARLSLRPHQRRRTHVSACLPPGAGPQSPANERPASAPPVFGGRGGRPRPAPLTIGPRSPATPHGATCTHPPVPTPCTHTAPTCHTP